MISRTAISGWTTVIGTKMLAIEIQREFEHAMKIHGFVMFGDFLAHPDEWPHKEMPIRPFPRLPISNEEMTEIAMGREAVSKRDGGDPQFRSDEAVSSMKDVA